LCLTNLCLKLLLGYIFEAYDANLRMNVALKMEKKDKSKNILKFEYQVLQHLKGKSSQNTSFIIHHTNSNQLSAAVYQTHFG